MKVHVEPREGLSRAMTRVANAIKRHAPSVQFVSTRAEADLVILHVIGYEETVRDIKELRPDQQYGIIQYCLRSTHHDCSYWMPIWANAQFVWSYYDLPILAQQDRTPWNLRINFYLSPLGVDPDIRHYDVPKKYVVMTSGYVAETETIREVHRAVDRAKAGKGFHLGPDLKLGPNVVQKLGIDDHTLAQFYSRCKFVSGLRHIEGFELPAAEGLVCGARPLLYDEPCYRMWYGDHAVYIKDGTWHDIEDQLVDLFSSDHDFSVGEEERAEAARRFSWESIISGLWEKILKSPVDRVEIQPMKPKLLWAGDAVAATGFAKCTHEILEAVRHEFDVTVLGVNYFGDPHAYPYPIFPCRGFSSEHDLLGFGRLVELNQKLQPDVILVQSDPWNVLEYTARLKRAESTTPVVGVVAVDSKNCRGRAMRFCDHVIFWTYFAQREAIQGGYDGPSTVIPLGVDLHTFRQIDRAHVRKTLGFPERALNGFVVGNVNRNQPRKRLDLTIQYFAEWCSMLTVEERNQVFLYLHEAPTADDHIDIPQLAVYYGLKGQVLHAEVEVGNGVDERMMPAIYSSFDVQVSTTLGEGWGLTTMEGMACGIPQIVPDWSALGEWARAAAVLVKCTTTDITAHHRINTIGGVADKQAFISALDQLYRDAGFREHLGKLGLSLVNQPDFRWENIGKDYVSTLQSVLQRAREAKTETADEAFA